MGSSTSTILMLPVISHLFRYLHKTERWNSITDKNRLAKSWEIILKDVKSTTTGSSSLVSGECIRSGYGLKSRIFERKATIFGNYSWNSVSSLQGNELLPPALSNPARVLPPSYVMRQAEQSNTGTTRWMGFWAFPPPDRLNSPGTMLNRLGLTVTWPHLAHAQPSRAHADKYITVSWYCTEYNPILGRIEWKRSHRVDRMEGGSEQDRMEGGSEQDGIWQLELCDLEQ